MKNEIPEHSLLKSIFLHLLPGLLAGASYFIIVPHVKSLGFPSVMALILSGIIILIPFELGFLIYQKRITGQRLFNGVIQYCKKIPAWQYFVLVPAIFVLSGLLFKAFGFTSDLLRPLFDWIPPDFILDMGLEKDFSKSSLIITYASFLIFFVLVVPTIEEFYFRGFLLPRMPSRLKGWTEIVHSGLFALYHAWTPWMFIIRTFAVLPLIYAVKRKQNVYIGIIAHCLLNSIDFFIGLIFILSI